MIAPCARFVNDQEELARFVLTDGWLYKDNRLGCKLRPIALIPSPHEELSVYRIDGWIPDEVRTVGQGVADERECTPHCGRLSLFVCLHKLLDIK